MKVASSRRGRERLLERLRGVRASPAALEDRRQSQRRGELGGVERDGAAQARERGGLIPGEVFGDPEILVIGGEIRFGRERAQDRGRSGRLAEVLPEQRRPAAARVGPRLRLDRNLMIATVLREVLQKLDLRYPAGDPALAGFTVK